MKKNYQNLYQLLLGEANNKTLNKYTYLFIYVFEESLVAIIFLPHYGISQKKCQNWFPNQHAKNKSWCYSFSFPIKTCLRLLICTNYALEHSICLTYIHMRLLSERN